MNKFIIITIVFLTTYKLYAQSEVQGLTVNAIAPDFTGRDQEGKEISLASFRKKGAVVVVFYRGNWCPYCNRALKKLQVSLRYITAKGASVIAISPEATDGIDKTIAKTGASFPVLYDKHVKIAKAYKVSYEVDEKTRTTYLEEWNVDFLKINEQKEKAVLPVPAVFIIDKAGKIIYRFFNRDITKRPSVQELLLHLN